MSNVTLSIDNELLEKGRNYARLHHTSLNHMIRESIREKVEAESPAWLEEAFGIMDELKSAKKSSSWKREDLYRV